MLNPNHQEEGLKKVGGGVARKKREVESLPSVEWDAFNCKNNTSEKGAVGNTQKAAKNEKPQNLF